MVTVRKLLLSKQRIQSTPCSGCKVDETTAPITQDTYIVKGAVTVEQSSKKSEIREAGYAAKDTITGRKSSIAYLRILQSKHGQHRTTGKLRVAVSVLPRICIQSLRMGAMWRVRGRGNFGYIDQETLGVFENDRGLQGRQN